MFLLFICAGVFGLLLLLVSFVFDGIFDFLDFDTPFISGAAIGALLAGFGFSGLLMPSSWPTGAVALGAGVVGIALAALAGWMSKTLMTGRTDETVRSDLVLGSVGTVVNRIDAGEYGEVSVTVAGHLMKYNAKADEAIPSGASIMVTDILSPSAVKVTRY